MTYVITRTYESTNDQWARPACPLVVRQKLNHISSVQLRRRVRAPQCLSGVAAGGAKSIAPQNFGLSEIFFCQKKPIKIYDWKAKTHLGENVGRKLGFFWHS